MKQVQRFARQKTWLWNSRAFWQPRSNCGATCEHLSSARQLTSLYLSSARDFHSVLESLELPTFRLMWRVILSVIIPGTETSFPLDGCPPLPTLHWRLSQHAQFSPQERRVRHSEGAVPLHTFSFSTISEDWHISTHRPLSFLSSLILARQK